MAYSDFHEIHDFFLTRFFSSVMWIICLFEIVIQLWVIWWTDLLLVFSWFFFFLFFTSLIKYSWWYFDLVGLRSIVTTSQSAEERCFSSSFGSFEKRLEEIYFWFLEIKAFLSINQIRETGFLSIKKRCNEITFKNWTRPTTPCGWLFLKIFAGNRCSKSLLVCRERERRQPKNVNSNFRAKCIPNYHFNWNVYE